jgi:hypothetical protein
MQNITHVFKAIRSCTSSQSYPYTCSEPLTVASPCISLTYTWLLPSTRTLVWLLHNKISNSQSHIAYGHQHSNKDQRPLLSHRHSYKYIYGYKRHQSYSVTHTLTLAKCRSTLTSTQRPLVNTALVLSSHKRLLTHMFNLNGSSLASLNTNLQGYSLPTHLAQDTSQITKTLYQFARHRGLAQGLSLSLPNRLFRFGRQNGDYRLWIIQSPT